MKALGHLVTSIWLLNNAVLSSEHYVFASSWRDVLNRVFLGDLLNICSHSRTPRMRTDDCKTDCISRGHLYISFHNAHTYSLNHMTASTFFSVFFIQVLSAITSFTQLAHLAVKGQYAKHINSNLCLKSYDSVVNILYFLCNDQYD